MSYFQEQIGLRPYHFTYPERKLMMEEMLYKFIDEGKREHKEMRAFICDFQTTKEILFKERNNSLIELRFGVQELLKVINNTPMIDCEVKGVTTRGGKTMTQEIIILKEKLTIAPIIISPDWNIPFELMCDASDFTVGSVLGQKIDEKFKLAGVVTIVGVYGPLRMHFRKASPFGLVSMYRKNRDRHCAYRPVASIGG
ncbi:reverse transcriptase domain-containing protein [Tanacetum coccineum]